MHDFIQPYLSDLVNAVVGLAAALVIAGIMHLKQKATTYIDAHTTTAQRQLLHSVASEAVAYAGVVFKEQNGEQRLENALGYVNAHLQPYGISFSETELRGAVEKAYAAYKAQEPMVTNTTVQFQGSPTGQQLAEASERGGI